MNNTDFWSKILDRTLDILFAKYPARTGLGVVLGLAISFLAKLFEPALVTLQFMDFKSTAWWGWIPFGILLMHIPTIVSLFKQKPIGNDQVDQAIELINRANFSASERRQQYRNLINKVSNDVAISQQTKKDINNVAVMILSQQESKRED